MNKALSLTFVILLSVGVAFAQKDKPKVIMGDSDVVASIQTSGDYHENGIFRSDLGKFSIAIAGFPTHIRNQGTEKAKAKGLDVGRQFVWTFEGTLYTLLYLPPVDMDGNPFLHAFSDIKIGTRKGIHNGGATLLSEKAFKQGKIKGTEFRYVLPNDFRFINRVFLIGDTGYQFVGGYADEKDEKSVIAVLNTFTPLKKPKK